MQGLNEAPRQNVLASDVTNLIYKDPAVQISYGCRWLDSHLTYKGQLDTFMAKGSSVSRDESATIQGTCTLNINSDAPINTVTDFVQPTITLTNDKGISATFYLGVYTLQTPDYDNSSRPAVLPFTGYDLLYFLQQPVGDSIQANAGDNPIDKATSVIGMAFPGAALVVTPTTKTLPVNLVWPFDASGSGYTYLDIVNELLKAAGYNALWVDWNGKFILEPYVKPSLRSIEATFDITSSTNIMAVARTSTQDLFTVPNFWQFIMNNIAGSPVEGTTQFTYNDVSVTNPGSQANRGRILNKKIEYVTAADYGTLYQLGVAQIVSDLSPSEVFTITTFPMPLAWHQDQITYVDNNIADIAPQKSNNRHTQSLTWTIPLDEGGGDMSWTLQTTTQ